MSEHEIKTTEQISRIATICEDVKADIQEIKGETKDINNKVGIQNGRVRTLEDWSTKAQVVIENNNETLSMYKIDKAKLWTAVAVVVFLGGAIITLSIMAIDTKIENGIANALAEFEKIEIK